METAAVMRSLVRRDIANSRPFRWGRRRPAIAGGRCNSRHFPAQPAYDFFLRFTILGGSGTQVIIALSGVDLQAVALIVQSVRQILGFRQNTLPSRTRRRAQSDTMAAATQLTQNDISVLGALFEREGSSFENSIEIGERGTSTVTLDSREQEQRAISSLSAAEPPQSDIENAIATFDELLREDEGLASVYNNRAQARRLLQERGKCGASEVDLELIWHDLERAIHLASNDTESKHQANVLAAAYTHRGFLLYQASRDHRVASLLPASVRYRPRDTKSLEELASRDFALGGRYGNRIAKRFAALTDPYARLCGQMVKRALASEVGGDCH